MVLCGQRDIGGSLPEQIAASAHRGSNARLLAGPGTGKTRTIVELVTSIVADGAAAPTEILCLTFTRAAAAGLRSKLGRALGDGPQPDVHTLHGFALRQLMARHANTGAGTDHPRIADDWEERNIVLEDLNRVLGAPGITSVRERLKALAAAWETRPEDDPATTHADAPFVGALEQHKRQYGYILRSELVYLLKRTIDQDPDFRFTGRYRWVIVDEYQDLNRCDIAVIDQVASRGAVLFVAGDDDQSIYQHLRHAHPDGIREFDATHAAADLRLATCVRCDQRIIEVATSVIGARGRTDGEGSRPPPDRRTWGRPVAAVPDRRGRGGRDRGADQEAHRCGHRPPRGDGPPPQRQERRLQHADRQRYACHRCALDRAISGEIYPR